MLTLPIDLAFIVAAIVLPLGWLSVALFIVAGLYLFYALAMIVMYPFTKGKHPELLAEECARFSVSSADAWWTEEDLKEHRKLFPPTEERHS